MLTQSHLSTLIHDLAARRGTRDVLTFRNFGGTIWQTVAWDHFSMRVRQVSDALVALGVMPGESIATFSQNCVQYLYTNFGIYGAGAVAVPFYATSSEQQVRFMVNDAAVSILFVGEQEQYDKARRILPFCPTLRRIILYDRSVTISEHDKNTMHFSDFVAIGRRDEHRAEVERRQRTMRYDDLCDILYTSGTTGESKGVMLTYGQYAAAFAANARVVGLRGDDRVISFLPYAHILERAWTYFALIVGAHVIVNTDPREIQASMRQTHPTSMTAVPRFWEKVYAYVMDAIDRSNPARRQLMRQALAIGKRRNIACLAHGIRPSATLELQYRLVNRVVLRILRRQLGIERPNIFPTAGATVSPEVEQFVHGIGLHMLVGYGLTESLATVSIDVAGKPFTIGSVGRPLPEVDVRISDEGEILLKGPTITKGYYKRDAENAAAFTADGYFRTGDAGYIRDGELFLTERIKDLFKTSNGKYVAPQMVEALLIVDKYIDQVAVVADKRKFATALIVPDFPLLEDYAVQHGIAFATREELCRNAEVHAMVEERIVTLQQQLASHEQVKRFTLLARSFTIDTGELTDTLKMRRTVIYDHFAADIEAMYAE